MGRLSRHLASGPRGDRLAVAAVYLVCVVACFAVLDGDWKATAIGFVFCWCAQQLAQTYLDDVRCERDIERARREAREGRRGLEGALDAWMRDGRR